MPKLSTVLNDGDIVYVAGPMRGIVGFNWLEFDKAAMLVQTRPGPRLQTINPIDLDDASGFDCRTFRPPESVDAKTFWSEIPKVDGLSGMSLKEIINRDLAAIMHCQGMYMLSGWENLGGRNGRTLYSIVAPA